MALEEKLKHFQDLAIAKTKANCEASLEELKKSLDEQFEEYKNQAVSEAAQREQAEIDGIKKKSNLILSKEEIKIRYELADNKTKLTDRLFDDVKDKLDEFRKSDEYPKLLLKYIQDAKTFANGEDMTVYLDADDLNLKDDLERASGLSLKVSAYSFGGGMRALIPSKNILIENSFSEKLAEEKCDFIEKI